MRRVRSGSKWPWWFPADRVSHKQGCIGGKDLFPFAAAPRVGKRLSLLGNTEVVFVQGSEQEDVVTTFLHGGIHSIIAVGSPRWVRGGCSAVCGFGIS